MVHKKANWTILTYIAAHNNLDQLGGRSLKQILEVGSTPDVQLAVLYDGTERAARYIAGEPGTAAVEESLDDLDSGDAGALLDTVRWAFGQRPAERYGLILWSHGSGWRPEEIEEVAKQARGDEDVDADESTERAGAPGGLALFRSTLAHILKQEQPERAILFDDGTGHSLDTLELAWVTSQVQDLIGQPLDLLGMDACLMGNLEVAYQLRDSVRYLVASEELVPGHSWPYDTIFGELAGEGGMPAEKLAKLVVQRYCEYYKGHPPGAGDVTKVALDLSGVNQVAQAVDRLATLLEDDIDAQADLLWKAQWESFLKESREQKRKSHKFRYHLWDVGSVSTRLAEISDSDSVKQAAATVAGTLEPGGPTVLVEDHYGEWFDGIAGVSIYMIPPKKRTPSQYYADLALAKDTHWNEMLEAYHDYYA
jgi:hypothetical protein